MMRGVLDGFVKVTERATTVVALVGQAGLFVMTPLICADIFMRFVFRSPIAGVLEIVSALNVTVTFLSVPLLQRLKGHVRVDILLLRLPPAGREILETFAWIVGVVLFGLLNWTYP